MNRKARRAVVPAFIQRGIELAERERRASILARPIRAMFDMLQQGDVYESDGQPVMRMPEHGDSDAEWCAIAPAIRGWIDIWSRLDAGIKTTHLAYLADRLEAEKELTPRLIEQARAQFEACVCAIPGIEPGRITQAITTTQIAWELETAGRHDIQKMDAN